MIGPDTRGGNSRMLEKAAALALLAYAAVVAFLTLRRRKRALQALLSKLCLCRRRPRKLTNEEAARERRILAECETRRVERGREFIVAGNLLNLLIGATMLHSIRADTMTSAQACVVGAGLLVSSTAALFVSRLTQRGLDALYLFVVLIMVALKVAHEQPVDAKERGRNPLVLFHVLYWSIANPKPWLNVLGFLCIATTETLLLSVAGDASLAVFSCFTYVCGAAWMVGVDYCLKRSVRMEIMAADCENELEAINTLLDSICDVILKLDGGLRLKSHSPKLADILLIRNPDKSLEGEDLRAYMPTDRDRATFTEHVQGSLAASAHASVFHTKMRDFACSNIDVEFFSVGFRGRDGGHHHILGIREFTDTRPVLPPQGLPAVRPSTAIILDMEGACGAPRAQQLGKPVDGAAARRDSGSCPSGPVTALPQTDVAPLPPRLQLEGAPPPARRKRRGEPRVGLGTPAALEQSDIKSHSSSSDYQLRSDPGDRSAASGGEQRETLECVKLLSLTYAMTSWALKTPKGACCPLHSALLDLECSLLPALKSGQCQEDFGEHGEWQCPRCGIKDDEQRDPKHRSRCLLCKRISDSHIQRSGSEGSMGKVAM